MNDKIRPVTKIIIACAASTAKLVEKLAINQKYLLAGYATNTPIPNVQLAILDAEAAHGNCTLAMTSHQEAYMLCTASE
jgi:hypothetical protein